MSKPINVIQEFKDEIRRLEHQRDLYRARAIDEVADHHNTDRTQAAFDVDAEVMRHLQGVR